MCAIDANEPLNMTGQKSSSPGNTDDPREHGKPPALDIQNPLYGILLYSGKPVRKAQCQEKGNKILMIDELTQQSKRV